MKEFTHAFAVPGENNIIDIINPATGRSVHRDETLAQMRVRYPKAEVVSISDFCIAKAARQDSPITWSEVTEEQYWEMLEVLPPALMRGGDFLVGEPMDHHSVTGRPRFSAYASIGERYFTSSRPLQVSEFKSAVAALRANPPSVI